MGADIHDCCSARKDGRHAPYCKSLVPPTRRIELTIRISADSEGDVEYALREIRTNAALHHDNAVTPCVSAGYSASWTIERVDRPEQTGDNYRREVEAYVAELGASASAKSSSPGSIRPVE